MTGSCGHYITIDIKYKLEKFYKKVIDKNIIYY